MTPVHLTQFLRPNGRTKLVDVNVPDDVADGTADMVLTCEVLMSGEVGIYGRWPEMEEEDEIMRIALILPGPLQPDLVTIEVINAVKAIPRGVRS